MLFRMHSLFPLRHYKGYSQGLLVAERTAGQQSSLSSRPHKQLKTETVPSCASDSRPGRNQAPNPVCGRKQGPCQHRNVGAAAEPAAAVAAAFRRQRWVREPLPGTCGMWCQGGFQKTCWPSTSARTRQLHERASKAASFVSTPRKLTLLDSLSECCLSALLRVSAEPPLGCRELQLLVVSPNLRILIKKQDVQFVFQGLRVCGFVPRQGNGWCVSRINIR